MTAYSLIKSRKKIKMKNKSIYELELHESISLNVNYCNYIVTRVPGGWIYMHDESLQSVFVPLNKNIVQH